MDNETWLAKLVALLAINLTQRIGQNHLVE